MAVTIRLNIPNIDVPNLRVFECVEMTRQMGIANTDPAIRANNIESWVDKQNKKEKAFARIPLTDGLNVLIDEGIQGNTIVFNTDGTLANLIAKCPELEGKRIVLDIEARVRIEDKPIIDAEPEPTV